MQPSKRFLRLTAVMATLSLPFLAPATTSAAETWTTVFQDDFDGAAGTGLNTQDWLYDRGTGYPGGAAAWGTGELETATDSTDNVYHDGAGPPRHQAAA